jgi:DNA (cytosine-5)-methyltransferase 1
MDSGPSLKRIDHRPDETARPSVRRAPYPEPVSDSPRLTVVDLFCGAGGLSAGLSRAGLELVAAADHDPDACATYRLNFPGTALVEGDLAEPLVAERLRAAIDDVPVDLLVGGPPCQAFSQVRNHDRLIEDPRNRLYKEFVRAVSALRPRGIVLENVVGMNQINGGSVRRQIEQDLTLDGLYRVTSGILDAGDFGVPQRRPRLLFVGVRADLGAEPVLPAGTGITSLLRNGSSAQPWGEGAGADDLWAILRDPADARIVTASQALSDLLEPGDDYSTSPASAYQVLMREESAYPQDHTPSRIREDTRRRLEAIPPGGNIYDLPQDLLARYLGDAKWGPAGNGLRLSRRHYYAYRRLHPDWLAWTANTKADFAYHYAAPRGLSVREAARIQGFPDSFHFTTAPPGTPGQLRNGARHSRYRQVGNAVPPLLAEAVGVALAGAISHHVPTEAAEPAVR